ncbi:MAG: M20/M25/M40 family metallo-hydrolase [Anaerolineae bacterium]|nr:M20/M25/M40 family metallo-hydrolase [Anaerolineae bacterium]
MKKLLVGLILLAAAFMTACGSQTTPTVTVAEMPPTPRFTQTQAPMGSELLFDGARAYEQNRRLAVDIGTRVAGTQGGQNAADYIASEFEESGLEVTRQAFTFEGWEDRGTTVQLIGANAGQLDANPIQYSVGGNVEGDIVLTPGTGTRNDFSRVNVRGKIALVKRGTLSFGEKAQNAAEVGAKAILIYNERPESFTGTLRERVSIPTIALSGAAGQEILKRLPQGTVRVQIKSDSGVEQRTGYNVIGTLKGKTAETIVLGGHYDSVSAGPGAGDNGSGTAVVLELARALAQKPQPEHTLVFVAFDAEELGLVGSRAYVDDLSESQLGEIRAMLNFDMLGAGGGPLILMGNGDVALLARSSAQQLGIDARNGSMPSNAGSDHESFARQGVDTVFFMRDYDLLHTPDDTINQVKEQYLDEAGRVAERVLERLDAAPVRLDSSKLMPTE